MLTAGRRPMPKPARPVWMMHSGGNAHGFNSFRHVLQQHLVYRPAPHAVSILNVSHMPTEVQGANKRHNATGMPGCNGDFS